MNVDVIESYRDWSPPSSKLEQATRELLASVPAGYLAGLQTVVLTNSSALSGEHKRRRVKSSRGKCKMREVRGARCEGARVRGLYHHKTDRSPAWIELFVDHIYDGIEQHYLKIPILRKLLLADILFHEVGHHLHAGNYPEYRDKEDVADAWSRRLKRRWMRGRYKWLLPVALVWVAFEKIRRLFSVGSRLGAGVRTGFGPAIQARCSPLVYRVGPWAFGIVTLVALSSAVIVSLDPANYHYYKPSDRAGWAHPTDHLFVVCVVMLVESLVVGWGFFGSRPRRAWVRGLVALAVMGPWAAVSTLVVLHVPYYVMVRHLWLIFLVGLLLLFSFCSMLVALARTLRAKRQRTS